MDSRIGYVGIFMTIFFTTYSQIVIKWQMNLADDLPDSLTEKVKFLFIMLLNPWVMTSIFATFFAGLSWMLVMSKFNLSFAYPFVSSIYILMIIAGYFLFHETVTVEKLLGSGLIVAGIIVLSRG